MQQLQSVTITRDNIEIDPKIKEDMDDPSEIFNVFIYRN